MMLLARATVPAPVVWATSAPWAGLLTMVLLRRVNAVFCAAMLPPLTSATLPKKVELAIVPPIPAGL